MSGLFFLAILAAMSYTCCMQELQAPEHDLKYIQDLTGEFYYYVAQLIVRVYMGVCRNIGVANPDTLAAHPPTQLAKGYLGGLAQLGSRLKRIVGRRLNPNADFVLRGMKLYKKDGKPLTVAEWRAFEKQVTDYLRPYLDSLAEEMAVKGILLSMASSEMEKQGKSVVQYGMRSYKQIENEYFHGYIPDSLRSMEDRYKMDANVKKETALAYTRAADYMTRIDDRLRSSVKRQIEYAHRHDLSASELASNLFWSKEDIPELGDYTAQVNLRDWRRVAHTELATIHERGKLAIYEDDAQNSLDNPEKAVYLVFNGTGRCEWCKDHQGTIVRLIPLEAVGDEMDDSLSSKGIEDPYTNTAVWPGKNNVGLKQSQWRICTPVHPWCGDTFSRIYPEFQEYDKDTGRIRYKLGKEVEKYVPTDIIDEIETEKAKYRQRQDILAKQRAESLQRRK